MPASFAPTAQSLLVFDIEADGLLTEEAGKTKLTRLHCLVTRTRTGETKRYHESSSFSRDGNFEDALNALDSVDYIAGHGIQAYDIPALQLFYKDWKPKAKVLDTLVLSRLMWTDLGSRDWERLKANPDFPRNMIGRHSLEAWGWRLKFHKGDFALLNEWAELSEPMLEYCARDVELTAKLMELCFSLPYPEAAVYREHRFAEIIDHMMRWGIGFDKEAALKLVQVMQMHRARLEAEMKPIFGDFTDEYVTPKKQIKKIKTTIFNPRSNAHIARHLIERHGWKPTEYTKDGKPCLDEQVFETLLHYPGLQLLAEHFDVQRRLATVAEGNTNWLSLSDRDGRLHGYVNHNGARTHRCSHSRPNMTQAPRVGTLYGKECRSLLGARQGWRMVGVDAEQLELRCFAHYTHQFDKGAYAQIILSGDVHSANQKAAGLETRDQAKTFIYALLYGAGDAKMGSIVGGGAKEGAALKAKFFAAMPGIKKLLDSIYAALLKRKHLILLSNGRYVLGKGAYLIGVDGRRVPIGKVNDILNTLLQHCGAIVMKEASIVLQDRLQARGLVRGQEYGFALHVHDEIQVEAQESLAELVSAEAKESIREAGVNLGLKCPLAGSSKIGQTWADTH